MAAVLCLRFPAYLTTPELRVHYDMELLRLNLALAMVAGAGFGIVALVLGGSKFRCRLGLASLLLAMLPGERRS